MNYKYQKRQLFGKRLKVPKEILNKVYLCTLSFNEFIKYQLEDKIPTSCIEENDRKILERFGMEKCKELDWEVINRDTSFKDMLISIDPKTEDINLALYELVKDQIEPSDYSPKMAEIYSDRLFEISENENDEKQNINYLKVMFNRGKIRLDEIISNWELFKDKDLSYCLLKDSRNESNITDSLLKEFMKNYGVLAPIIIKHLRDYNIYTIINNISNFSSEEEKHNYLKQITDVILSKSSTMSYNSIKLTDEQYKEIFKYSSLEQYLKKFNRNSLKTIIEELKSLPQDYIFNIPFSFSELLNYGVSEFVGTYGLKNIVDFDNECGHFFTNNNCELLKSMYDMYDMFNKHSEKYSDPHRTIFMETEERGKYTKDEFYEVIKRMLLYGDKNNKIPDYRNITGEFRTRYKELFISEEAPQELQEAFYSRNVTTEFILSNPSYRNYLNNVDLEVIFKDIPVKVANSNERINIVSCIKQKFGEKEAFDIMLLYGKCIEQVYEENGLKDFTYNIEFTQEEFLDELDKIILQNITNGNVKYDESMSNHFKKKNPTLFLGADVPQEIKNKFYNREFTIEDFNNNPELLNIFESKNIVYAFPTNMAWIDSLFPDSENLKTANYKHLRIISAYSKIQDFRIQEIFKKYIMKQINNIGIEKIEDAADVLARLSLSNSIEMFTFKEELTTQILNSSDPSECLDKIEDVFIRNNVPTVGKIYSCFEILHPDFQGFNFENSMISPVLKESSTVFKKMVVFSDLIKSSFGSNNKSVKEYLKNVEFSTYLYENIKSGKIQLDSLGEAEIRELSTFRNHLITLYNNMMKPKYNNESFKSTGNILTDILELSKKISPDGRTLDYNLADRVIRMFCGFAGIDTLEQAKEYMERTVKTADSRNRYASNSDMVLEQGDFIKGVVGGITPLRSILQNGCVSKEYLGAGATSDATPLDTDISMIMSSDGTTNQKINSTAASGYGQIIWFVLKNDDRFMTTRTSTETFEAKKDMSKLEVFFTGSVGQDHYGIRTGFASSEINYIVMKKYDPRVGLEIAMNGFYIPVTDKNGKIIFTPKDYDELRTKMSGLSYYDDYNYIFSKNLITEETEYFAEQIEQSNFEVQVKRERVNNIIKRSLEELDLQLKTNVDGDLTEGFVELIDTGSTGRGTNKPGDGDFDFMMKLDKNILSDPTKLSELKQTLLRNFGKENSSELTGNGDFRLKGVQIDTDMSVDIDITFTIKTDKILYSTDMSLQDRFATIQRNDPEKYKYVVANILLAKQVLKDAKAYKPNRGDNPEGGLGGVGIENWILQNGGSFIDAARSFVTSADGKSFSEFQSTYQIWDFGENHLVKKEEDYPHDNFVTRNMSEVGYQKMVVALKEYLKTMGYGQVKTGEIKR